MSPASGSVVLNVATAEPFAMFSSNVDEDTERSDVEALGPPGIVDTSSTESENCKYSTFTSKSSPSPSSKIL